MKEAFKLVKGSWLKYLLEFFVIIVSIISAFMLDNWHNQRQEYRKALAKGYEFDFRY